MTIDGIKGIKTVVKEFSFKDLSAFTDYAESCFTGGGEIIAAPSVKDTGTLKNGLRCIRIYDAGITVYYCSDGKLYRKVNGEFKDYGVPAFNVPPDVFSVVYDGQKSVAAVFKTGAYLLNDRISFVSMVKGSAYAVHKGTLLIAKGKRIIVCGEAAYNGEEISLAAHTFLYPEGKYGAVLKFIEISGELFAICQRGAVKISVTGEDMGYAIENLPLPRFKCFSESVVSFNNEAYFLSVNGLFKFDKNRVRKVNSFFDKKMIEPCGEATLKDHYYLIPVNVGGDRKIYCYNTVSGKDCFIKGEGLLVAGGATASFTTDKIGEIGVFPCARVWKSVKTDFGYSGVKTLSAIRIKSDCDLTVKVEGDGVERTFTVKAGDGETPLSVRAEKFTITVTDSVGNPANRISEISVKYRV